MGDRSAANGRGGWKSGWNVGATAMLAMFRSEGMGQQGEAVRVMSGAFGIPLTQYCPW